MVKTVLCQYYLGLFNININHPTIETFAALKNFKESTLIKARIVNEIDESNLDYEILKSKTEIL